MPGPESDLGESIWLVQRAQGGDQGALNELLARYSPRLHRIARIRMGAELRGVMESMDLVQRANLTALRKLGSFEVREQASILHWLAKILEHKIRDELKRIHAEKRDRSRELPLEGPLGSASSLGGFQPAADGPSPSQEAGALELQQIYDECVEQLDSDHRDVILLRDYEGGSWTHVCERMGRANVHAVQELHRRARIKLARCLGRRTRGIPDDRDKT